MALGDADARSVDVAEVFAGDSGEEAFAVDVAEAFAVDAAEPFAVDADEEAVRVCRAVVPGEAIVLPVCVLVDAGGE